MERDLHVCHSPNEGRPSHSGPRSVPEEKGVSVRTTTLKNTVVRPQTEGERRWATLAQAAVHTGVSTKTMRRWVATGVVLAYRAGPKLVRIDLAELDAMLEPIPAAGGKAA